MSSSKLALLSGLLSALSCLVVILFTSRIQTPYDITLFVVSFLGGIVSFVMLTHLSHRFIGGSDG